MNSPYKRNKGNAMKRLLKNTLLTLATVTGSLTLSTAQCQENTQTASSSAVDNVTDYEAKDFQSLFGTKGFSNKTLTTHFKLYEGYVKNTNAVLKELQKLTSEGKARTPCFAELERRFGWEFNGMRLHELYFENLGGNKLQNPKNDLYAKIKRDFGSLDDWSLDFTAVGSMRGIGWVVLFEDPRSGRLMNVWINEHDGGVLAGAKPLLIMDVFEHAYLIDYGLDRASYIKAFLDNVNWNVVETRAAS
jgi:Fe-Mn family superoxide dismutase